MSTIKDVAALAGVSFTTVSHVLNNTRPVSAQARARVLAAVDEIGYLPSAVARSLRRSETKIVGVLVPNVRNPFFAELVVGVEEWCRQAGYSVFLCNSDNDPKHQQSYLRTLLEKRIDGLLLSSAGDADALATTFRHASVPVVTVDRLVPGARADRVSVNNQVGATAAVRHLLDLGHRRIGCVSGPAEFEVTQERVAGWRGALHAYGIEAGPDWLIESDFSTAGGYEAVKALLTRQPDLTAVFTSNDLMAMGALRAAAELGRAVPRQLSVVGFDGIELGSYIYPAITSVGCSIRDLGREAGRALIERIENPQAPFKDLQLTPQLVLRESTSAPLSSEQA
ncbi:LacI family DNA-binding transcriptional regulator [Roseateles sp. SL47]|jgi:LacI family transcriptional regulator|uniref:LacI family DNA-binding transcriptional regulator n=1 Tax=Roseateles sp. SL47 TaxID=2995138 RepID=UPI002270DF72|nr:LacI family DNA-binding transcriptional regulator [Roseateles sp. SL47]WAC71319.1 LacI family DNA-binding transcriptional regulator [Roseateles sp. SL47]